MAVSKRRGLRLWRMFHSKGEMSVPYRLTGPSGESIRYRADYERSTCWHASNNGDYSAAYKHGDASQLNMYRGITLSSAVSKLFEYIMLILYDSSLQSDNLQYGFRRGTGCVYAVFTIRESIRYFYISR